MTEPSNDLLHGADAIAEFLLGKTDRRARRRVYHLSESDGLPTFKLGGIVCSRKSDINAWLEKKAAGKEKAA